MTFAFSVTCLLLAVTLGSGQVVNQTRTSLKRDLLLEMFQSSSSLASIELYDCDRATHRAIMEEIIEEELNSNSSRMVIGFIARQRDDFLNFGYMKIYQTLKKNNLNDYVLFDLAFQINKDQCRGKVISLLSLFPPSVRALLTPNQICINNVEYREYLYAGEKDSMHGAMRRDVFTLPLQRETDRPCDWRFEHVEGNKFKILNSLYGEYMYAEGDSCNGYDNDRRKIFTRQRLDASLAGIWDVEVEGSAVLLRNVLYGEYVYALRKIRVDGDRRRVSSWVPKGSTGKCGGENVQCKWTLLVC